MNSLLAYLTRFLQSLLNPPGQDAYKADSDESAESIILLPPGVEKEAGPSQSEGARPPLPRRMKGGIDDRLAWLKQNPVAVALILLVVIAVWFSEHDRFEWWTTQMDRLAQYGVAEGWQAYRYRLLLLFVLLFLFFSGPVWFSKLWQSLLDLWRWSARHRALTLALAAAIAVMGVSAMLNANTWSFGIVEVGVDDLEVNDIAIQFRGSLNAIGTAPFDKLAFSAPGAPKKVQQARTSLEHLSLADCSAILLGPDAFDIEGEPIPLKRPQSGDSQSSGGHTITLSTAVGSVDLPLEGFFRSLLRFFSPNYREFSIQIISAGQADELDLTSADDDAAASSAQAIRIIINDNRGWSRTVVGPRQDLPQLVNFLVHRMTLDLLVLPGEPISNSRLALTLGNRAFDSRDFDSALAYYRLAASFKRKDPVIQTALGITHYQLSTLVPENRKRLSLLRARQALQRAQLQSNSLPVSLPYLACLQAELGQAESANETLAQFNNTLSSTSQEAVRERLAQLGTARRPVLGPGHTFSLFMNRSGGEAAATFNLSYFSGSQIFYYQNISGAQSLASTPVQSDTLAVTPRQIFAVQDGAYYVTQDGLVNRFQPGRIDRPIIEDSDLEFTLPGSTDKVYTGGITQIFVQPPYLFAAGRFGQIMRYRLDTDGGGGEALLETSVQADARQIFLDGDTLYLLRNDGAIWRIPNALLIGSLEPTRQLVADIDIQEIAVNQGNVYMLRQDDTLWLYRDRAGASNNLMIPLDQGVGTERIFAAAQGLFYLKATNEVFFIPIASVQLEAPALRQLTLPEADRQALIVIEETLIVLESSPDGRLKINTQDVSNEAPILTPPAQVNQGGTATAIAAVTAAITQTATAEAAEATAVAVAIEANKATATQVASATMVAAATIQASTIVTTVAEATPAVSRPTPQAVIQSAQTQVNLPATPTSTSRPAANTSAASPLPTPAPSPLSSPAPTAAVRVRELDGAVEILINRREDSSRRFWIDSTEVSNRQYRRCIEAEQCLENQQYSGLFSREDHPVVGVTYHQAQRYCEWAGGALPTANQWRQAASPAGMPYPWGDTPGSPTCDVAIINAGCDRGEPGTRPVGSKPAGARRLEAPDELIYDLIGNVWEWTQEPGPGKGNLRIVLGGSWSNPDGVDPGNYTIFDPFNMISQGETHQERNLGFRCVRSFEVENTLNVQQN